MNKPTDPRDEVNLAFLLLSSDAELHDWRMQCDDDDVEYALELLQTAYARVLELSSPYYTTPEGFHSASSVLARFRL